MIVTRSKAPTSELPRVSRPQIFPSRSDENDNKPEDQGALPIERATLTVYSNGHIPIYPSSDEPNSIAPNLIGISPSIKELRQTISLVAPTKKRVLISGETGTGKELVARAIHENSYCREGPFIAINCAAIPQELADSILFGHEKGAYTDAIQKSTGLIDTANDGTLFIDEIQELPLVVQAKLHRFLDSGKFTRVGGNVEISVTARIICATNRALEGEVKKNKFKAGLYYRIKGFSINLTPLREHKEDIRFIANNFIVKNKEIVPGKTIVGFSNGAIDLLESHDWPGNVRELENVIKRAMVFSNGSMIQEKDITISPKESLERGLEFLEQVAVSDANVFITGETGTGKEMIAKTIHDCSSRKDKPFVVVNCAAMPDSLAESELFGHEKGAFTSAVSSREGKFTLANGGTLFLDEVATLSKATQAKLLRVLQEQEFYTVGGKTKIKVNVRILAATDVNLEEAVKRGDFREDSYYRLNVVPVRVKSLRERTSEIPKLVKGFIDDFNETEGRNILGISDEAVGRLLNYNWPGNIRELKNIIEQACIFTKDGECIKSEHILVDSVLIRDFNNLFGRMLSKGDIDWNVVKTIAVKCYEANKTSKPSISEIAHKFDCSRSTVKAHISRELESESDNCIELHPSLNKYAKEFLYKAMSNETIPLTVFQLIALKCTVLKQLFEGCNLSESCVGKKLGIDGSTISRFVRQNGYNNFAELIKELSEELKSFKI